MKTIETRWFGPSNVKGSRYKAMAEGVPSVTLPTDYSLNADENHDRVALRLAEKYGWLKDHKGRRIVMARGGLRSGKGNVYVFVDKWTIVRPNKKTESKRSR